MSNIIKLETYIHALVKKNNELRKEHDKVLQNTESIKNELKKAQNTIEVSKHTTKKMEKTQRNSSDIKDRKNEIIKQIESLVTRIDDLNIEDITNVW